MGECWFIVVCVCMCGCVGYCYSSCEPFTYLFPRPNSTAYTGGLQRPYMSVFNWLLINSAKEAGDNKLPGARERELADKFSVGGCGVCQCYSLSVKSVFALFIHHSFLFI